jgi:hypothetical protein
MTTASNVPPCAINFPRTKNAAARLLRVACLSFSMSAGVSFGRSILSVSLSSLPVKTAAPAGCVRGAFPRQEKTPSRAQAEAVG